jgi:hypothetical protein
MERDELFSESFLRFLVLRYEHKPHYFFYYFRSGVGLFVFFFLFYYWWGGTKSLGTAATSGLLYKQRMIVEQLME